MKALLIVGSILLFFIFLLSIRIRFCLDFSGELHINLRILCFRIQIHPKKITPKRILKMQKKQEKKAAKQFRKHPVPNRKKAPPSHQKPKKKVSPAAVLRLAGYILRSVWKKFPRCFHLHLRRCVIVVAGKDAANTAILYGAVRGTLAWFCTLLDTVFTVKTDRNSRLSVEADFLGHESSIDLSLVLSTSLGAVIRLLFSILIAYLRRPRLQKEKTASIPPAAPQT